jgi:hypothetical protein
MRKRTDSQINADQNWDVQVGQGVDICRLTVRTTDIENPARPRIES